MREEEAHEKVREGKPTATSVNKRLSQEVGYFIDRLERLEARVAELEKVPEIDPEMVRNSALEMIREIERTTHLGGLDELEKA